MKERLLLTTVCYGFMVLLSSTGLAVSADTLAQAMPPTQVRVTAVRQQTLQERRQVPGNLRAVSRAQVASIREGRVEQVEVNEGSSVAKGGLLAKIDDRTLKLEIAETESEVRVLQARVREREAEVSNAQADLDALEQASRRAPGTVSEQQIRAQATLVKVAEARVEATQREIDQVRSRLSRLQLYLSDTEVLAPFDGRVVRRHIEPGEWVNPGDPVVTLVSTGMLEAWIEVPEQFDYSHVINASQLEVTLNTNGNRLLAQNPRIVSDVDPRSRRYNVIASLNDPKTGLSPGMSITAFIPTGSKAPQLLVPTDAVLRDSAGHYLYKAQSTLDGGHIAQPIPVRVLFSVDDAFVVKTEELAAGDLVVIEGNERLRPATPIAPFEG